MVEALVCFTGKLLKASTNSGLPFKRMLYSRLPILAVPEGRIMFCALIAAEMKFFRFNKTNLGVTATAFPALNEPGRIFLNTNVMYYIKITGDLSWNISLYGNWDNQPPPNFSGSDYGTSSGLGWTFGNR